MNNSRRPKILKQKIGRKKQSKYSQDRKKRRASRRLYLPCAYYESQGHNHRSKSNSASINFNTFNQLLQDQEKRNKQTKRSRYTQDGKKRRLHLPCSYYKRIQTTHHPHGYKNRSYTSLDSIDSATLNQLVEDQNNTSTKCAGSWKIQPKDSYTLTKKRLRRKKGEKDDDSSDEEQKGQSETKRKKPEPNKYHNDTTNTNDDDVNCIYRNINESSLSSSGSSVIHHYISDSTVTSNSEEDNN